MKTNAMDPVYAEMLRAGQYHNYLNRLAREGLGWWFRMDVPRISLHMQPLLRQESFPPLTPRVAFLAEVVDPSVSLQTIESFYQLFVEVGDWEAVCASVSAGIASIWDSGFDFRRFALWLERIDWLLAGHSSLTSLARASLLGFKAIATINGTGDINAGLEICRQQGFAAAEAQSASLCLFHGALQTYCHLLLGELSAAGILLHDTELLADQEGVTLVSRLFLHSSRGLFYTIHGEPETGRQVLQQVADLPFFDQMQNALWLLVHANLLFAISNCQDRAALAQEAEKLLQRAIPEYNAFHHSYAHFSLGVAALGMGQPHQALAHANQAIDRGVAAFSAVAERMPVLLKGQALVDLGRHEEALALFDDWMDIWLMTGFRAVAATAVQEAAVLLRRLGRMEDARSWYQRVHDAIPRGERLPMFHRPKEFADNLHHDFFKVDSMLIETPQSVLRVRCLGEFSVAIDGRQVEHDRNRRALSLLKVLIIFGGSQVGAETVADLLWPDTPGDLSYQNLKVLVWRLRRLAQVPGQQQTGSWLIFQQGHLDLELSLCDVDVFQFQRALRQSHRQGSTAWSALQVALDLYSGDFLPADDSEIWIIKHRHCLRRSFLDGVLRLADTACDATQRLHSIEYLHRALDIAPQDEQVYERLMHIYLDLGYPAKALLAYHDAQAMLMSEMGVAPGPALVALAKAADPGH